jgi:hypothetical protein
MHTYIHEYYSVMKNNGLMSFSGKGIELGNIMLSEISQTENKKEPMFPFIVESRPKK